MPHSSISARTPPALLGAVAMTAVGGSMAVSAVLADAPVLAAQALRYAVACLVLVAAARAGGIALHRPRGAEWWWLAGTSGCGLVVFNLAVVTGSRHAEPAVLGVAVAGVPVLLAVVGPLLSPAGTRRAPQRRAVRAAVAVTVGAVLVQGGGRTDLLGSGCAVVVLLCEAGFTLLALPVLDRHGAWGVSVHSTGLAALAFTVLGAAGEGPTALTRLDGGDLLATGYLSLAVTALAFVLWYTSVRGLGAARAGLLTGVAPIAAAVVGVALGDPVPGPAVWVGLAVVLAALAGGLPGASSDSRARDAAAAGAPG